MGGVGAAFGSAGAPGRGTAMCGDLLLLFNLAFHGDHIDRRVFARSDLPYVLLRRVQIHVCPVFAGGLIPQRARVGWFRCTKVSVF